MRFAVALLHAQRAHGSWLVRQALVALAVAMALGVAAGSPTVASAKLGGVKLSASLPPAVKLGRTLSAHGRVKGRTAGVKVILQQKAGGHWVARANARPGRSHAYRVRWRVPVHPQVMTMRVAAVRGAKTLTTSKPRRLLIKAPVKAVDPTRAASVPEPGSAGEVRFHGAVALPAHSIVAMGTGPTTPYGFLGEVVASRREGADTVVSTVPTSLLAAAPEGNIDVTSADAGPTGKRAVRAAAAQPLQQQIAKNFSCEAGGEMSLSGSVSVRSSVAFSAHWSLLHGVDKASFKGTATASASLSASADGSASCTLKKTPLLAHPWTLDPIDIQVGPVPVVIVPEVQVYVSGDGKVTAKVSTGIDASVSASAGLSYDHGHVGPISSFDQSFNYTPPTASRSAHVGGQITPTLDLLFYGVGGPEVTFTAGLDFDADPSANPWWSLTAPVDLGAKLSVPILGISTGTFHVYHHVFDIAHATDAGPGGSSTGTGPTGPGPVTGPDPGAPAQGPLTVDSPARHIAGYFEGADLACSLTTQEDVADEFFTHSDSGNDACGTFLAVGGELFGPTDIPAGGALGDYAPWTPVGQAAGGTGTVADPYTVTTTVAAGDTGVRLTQVDRWLDGGAVVDSTYRITANAGDTDSVVLYRAADCYVGDSDYGTGSYDAATASAGCLQDSGDGTAIDEALVPVSSGGQSAEDAYTSIWSGVASQEPFGGGALTDPSYDNGEGTSWALTLAGTNPVIAESRFDFHTVAYP
jgi:hypothetical protein